MNKKQAIQIIKTYCPCTHSERETKFRFGTNYTDCKNCGETFLTAEADDYVKRGKDFEDVLEYLLTLEEPSSVQTELIVKD